jgi:peptidoglycan/LPS O-acetylase OafA/YrhL
MSQAYLAGIDTLRALAVLSVIVFHVDASWLPQGFIGVDIFFVISGYVVAKSLANGPQGMGLRKFLLVFYARRLVRLYPALVACLLATFLMSAIFVPSAWLSQSVWRTGLMAFAGLSNFGLVIFTDGYFAPNAESNPFTHTWSLGVEEQFYLLFPVLAFWLMRKREQTSARRSTWLLVATCLVSLALCALWTTSNPSWAFFLLPARWWELGAGVLLLLAHQQQRLLPATGFGVWVAGAAGMAIVTLALLGPVLLPALAGFPWPGALLPVLGTVLMLCAIAASHTVATPVFRRVTQTSVLTYVGRLSYSLYLWHWPVLVLARWTVGLDDPVWRVCALAVTALLAVVSYHGLERPVRQWWQRRPPTPARTLGVGWLAVGGATAMALGLVLARPVLGISRPMQEASLWYSDQAAKPVAPTLGAVGPLAGQRLWVVGDSHAGAYLPLFAQLRAQDGMVVNVMWAAGCSVAKFSPLSSSCEQFMGDAFARLAREAQPGDMLFLPGLRTPRIANQDHAQDYVHVLATELAPLQHASRQAGFKTATQQLGSAAALGLLIVIEAPKPTLPAPLFRCSDWFNSSNPVCKGGTDIARAKLDPLFAPTRQLLAQLTGNSTQTSLWDPFNVLCPGAVCQGFADDGKPLYFAADHISPYGGDLLLPHLRAHLTQQVLAYRQSARLGTAAAQSSLHIFKNIPNSPLAHIK